MAGLTERLAAVVGPSHVIVDRDLLTSYEVDWTGRFSGRASLVVRPGSTAETAQVVSICHDVGAQIVTQGGNTGLVGGGVPKDGEVVLGTRRLDRVEFGEDGLISGAGAPLASVLACAAANGRRFPVDIAARDSATIGGMISTNAAGAFAARYGPMANQVLGVEAVAGDGGVIDQLAGPGEPDLVELIPGSEGTLAIVTAARLRTVDPVGATTTALLAVGGATEASERWTAVSPITEAAELMYFEGLRLVTAHLGVSLPVGEAAAYLLLEVDGGPEQLAEAVVGLGDEEVAIAGDDADRSRLWKLREAHAETVTTVGIPHTLDVKVDIDRLDDFVVAVNQVVAGLVAGANVYVYGHLADADIHINVVGADPEDERIDEAILQLVHDLGGQISGEHGLGRAKARWLHYDLPEEEIARWHDIKRRLDPAGILNVGVALPA